MNQPSWPVVWREGMLIAPQHLEQQDRHHRRALRACLWMHREQPWGVAACELDETALRDGRVALRRFSGILPDGTPVHVDGDEDGPEPRPLAGRLSGAAPALAIHLGLPEARPGGPRIAGDDGQTRLISAHRELADLVGESRRSVELARPRLRILLGDEAEQGHVSVQIAEVVRGEDGSFAPSPTYIPPAFGLAAAPTLRRALDELLALARAKRDALRELLTTVAELRDLSPLSSAQRHLLIALSTWTPALEALLRRPRAPLADIDLELRRMLGHLSCFGEPPAHLPHHDVHDLRASFGALLEALRSQLGGAVRRPCIEVPLEVKKGVWTARLADDRLQRCRAFVLAVEVEGAARDSVAELPGRTKIASWRRFNAIARNAVRGAPIAAIVQLPPEVPARPGHAYFEIEVGDEHWQDILRELTLAIYAPPPHDPATARLSLYAVPERS